MLLAGLLAASLAADLNRLLPAPADGPGCVLDARRGGEQLAARAGGLANLEDWTPLDADTVFEIGSVSKQFVGAGVALLAAQGKLSLDDPIRRWLPELPPLYRAVTVRMLLTHTSGIRSWNNLAELTGRGEDETGYDNRWVIAAVARQRALNHAPGAEYLYSNSNFVLAATIIERASHEALNPFFRHAFFDRFGMAHTVWRTDFRAVVPHRAQAYAPTEGGGWRLDMPFNDVVGAGGLLSTAGDLQRWNAALANPVAADRAWAALLATPGRLGSGIATRYGFGLELDPVAGAEAIAHAGSTASYRAWLGRFPASGLSIALLCNSGAVNTEELGPEIAALFLPVATEPPSAVQPTGAPADVAGLYRNLASDSAVEVTRDRDGLRFNGGPAFGETARNQLVSVDGRRSAIVTRDPRGRVRAIRLTRIGNAPVRLAREARWTPGAAQLTTFAGTYAGSETEGAQTLAVERGALVWRDPSGAAHPLTPTYVGAFDAEGTGWSLRFTAGARAGGMRVDFSITRARHIRFERVGRGGRLRTAGCDPSAAPRSARSCRSPAAR